MIEILRLRLRMTLLWDNCYRVILSVAKNIALLFVCFTLAGCAANKVIYPVVPSYDKVYYTTTKDGWSLAIQHYPPKKSPNGKPPVILCHGLNQNYLAWDLTPKWSFAQYLSERGFDVWSVSLRGSGKSTKPGWAHFLELNQLKPELLDRQNYDFSKFNWNMDDYISKDVPALLQFMKEKTGQSKFTWIGHSMGGMVMLAYLGQHLDRAIENLVLIGVPGEINRPKTQLQELILSQKTLVRMTLLINMENFSNMSVPFNGRLNGPLQILSYNSENMSRSILARFNSYVVENSSSGVISQITTMVEKGDFLSADGLTNYSENIPNIESNLLCLAGKLDNMAAPGAVLAVYHQALSPDKTYRLFGVANGYSSDYGHNDLLLGKNAPEEVYPYILNWLKDH